MVADETAGHYALPGMTGSCSWGIQVDNVIYSGTGTHRSRFKENPLPAQMACRGFADIPADGMPLLCLAHNRVDIPDCLCNLGLRGNHDRIKDWFFHLSCLPPVLPRSRNGRKYILERVR
jgi:hypothetical protein